MVLQILVFISLFLFTRKIITKVLSRIILKKISLKERKTRK